MPRTRNLFTLISIVAALAAFATPVRAQDDVSERLDRLEARLDALEQRLDRIEQLLEQRATASEPASAAAPSADSAGIIKASMSDGAIRATYEDWRVSVTEARIEKHVRLRKEKIIGGDEIMRSDRPLLVIEVEISAPTGKGIDYHSWRRPRVGSAAATLWDDGSRGYGKYDSDWIPDGGVQNRRVSGQGPVTDVLLFEAPPMEEVKHLVLHLPEAYLHGGLLPAGDEKFEFTIPASFVQSP